MVSTDVRRSSFWKAIAIVLIVVAALGVLIHTLNAGHHRPEGSAERWLAAVGDTARKGVSADARKRAERLGPVALAQPLLPASHDPRHSQFADLEVGKAREAAPDTVRVPFRLHQRDSAGTADLKRGTIVLHRTGDTWRVTAVDARRPDEKVPSEGGPPPSRAPLGLWLGAVALGLILATVAHLVTRYADRTAQRALAATGTS
ncbi:MAG: hypothetical protein JWP02_3463 [Acidimicrobiales bacterium]|nr:hypothetical protein [Acidimicrobiales bacterium]